MAINVLENIKQKVITLEEFFELEEESLHKNEFRNGKIIPMPNASINHNEISGNIFGHLFILSHQKQTFRTYNSDQKIYITDINTTTYPDVSVVVGAVEKVGKYAITNPTIIFEVLSDSTIRYDRGEKFKKYQKLSALKEYVLIDQDTPSVEVLSKTKEGWMIEIYLSLEDVIKLASIDCELKMSDIYKNVENLQYPQGKIDLDFLRE
jgi:Uma2 family endonuclease